MKFVLLAVAALALGVGAPVAAATNLIVNGSFEAGAPGVGGFTGWTKTNTPDGTHGGGNSGADQPASVIGYNNTNSYPTGAYGESVTPDNTPSASPDAVGGQAAYFVGDFSVNESISQLTPLAVGNYRIGFSYYLTQNGLNNVNNSSLSGTIIGTTVATTSITGASPAKVWQYASGVGHISVAGFYNTSFVFNSNGFPAKDVVIDRVFALPTLDAATVEIPPTPTAPLPEPSSWAMLIAGLGFTGVALRRRKVMLAAA